MVEVGTDLILLNGAKALLAWCRAREKAEIVLEDMNQIVVGTNFDASTDHGGGILVLEN